VLHAPQQAIRKAYFMDALLYQQGLGRDQLNFLMSMIRASEVLDLKPTSTRLNHPRPTCFPPLLRRGLRGGCALRFQELATFVQTLPRSNI
jgi:hypothetical protein